MNMRPRRVAMWVTVGVMVAAVGCTGTPEKKQAAYLERGQRRMDSRDYASAMLEYRSAIQVNPRAADPHYRLALACLAAGQIQEAVNELNRATLLDPKHGSAQLKLAELMVLSGKTDLIPEASEKAQAVLKDRPGDADALFVLSAIQYGAGQSKQAENYLHQALAKSPEHLKSSVALARMKLAKNDVTGAESVLLESVRKAPKSAEALVVLSGLYRSTGKLAEAESRIRAALQVDPKNLFALSELGGLQTQQGKAQAAEETYRQISTLPGEENQPALGIYYLQQNRMDQAIAEFSRVFRKYPSDRIARTRLVAAYLIANRVSDADAILQKAIKENPKDTEALLQRSRLQLMAGKVGEAESDLLKAIRNKSDSAEAHYLLAAVHAAHGNTLQQRQELNETLQLNPEFVSARIDLASVLARTGDPKGALDVLDAAPGQQKGLLAVREARNWAMISRGDLSAARKGVDEVMAAMKTRETMLQDGLLKLAVKNYSGARAIAEQILERNPGDETALRMLGQVFDSQRQSEHGTEAITAYVARTPKSAEAQFLLGKRLLKAGKRDAARSAFQAAKEANPNAIGAVLMLAKMDADENQLESARKWTNTILAADPQNASAWLILGMIEETAGALPQAIESYRKSLVNRASNPVALNNLASCLSRTNGGLDEALKYGQQAKELAPTDPGVADTLGWIYYQKQLYTSAVKELQVASLAADQPIVRLHLGLAYVQAGNKTHGMDMVAAVLKSNPELRGQVPPSALELIR